MIKEVHQIELYIEKNSKPKVRTKGEQIARVIDHFGVPSIEMNNQVATFRIMGTYFYTVQINNFLGEISSSCTCPYDWGGLCKHQVASLIYLSDYLKKKQPQDFHP